MENVTHPIDWSIQMDYLSFQIINWMFNLNIFFLNNLAGYWLCQSFHQKKMLLGPCSIYTFIRFYLYKNCCFSKTTITFLRFFLLSYWSWFHSWGHLLLCSLKVLLLYFNIVIPSAIECSRTDIIFVDVFVWMAEMKSSNWNIW